MTSVILTDQNQSIGKPLFRYLLIPLLTFIGLYAATPKPFAAIGDPVYRCVEPLRALSSLYAFKDKQAWINEFIINAEAAKQHGFALQKNDNRHDARVYLQQLRQLERQNRDIAHLVKTRLMQAIENDQEERYRQIVATRHPVVSDDATLQTMQARYEAKLTKRARAENAKRHVYFRTAAHLNGTWEGSDEKWYFNGDRLEIISRHQEREQKLSGTWVIENNRFIFSIEQISNKRPNRPAHSRESSITRPYTLISITANLLHIKEPTGSDIRLQKE